MEVLNLRLHARKNAQVRLVCMGCVHHGAAGCDEQLADFWYDYTLRTPDAYLVLGGDLVDGITERDKRYMAEEVAPWCLNKSGKKWGDTLSDRQYHYAAAKWKKLAKAGKILWIHAGNHEMSVKRFASRDLALDWSRELGIPYAGYSALINLNIEFGNQRNRVRVFSTHGSGSAQTAGAVMNSTSRLLDRYDVDVALMWHLHRRMHITRRALTLTQGHKNNTPQIVPRDRIAAICGTFLNGQCDGVTSYAEMKGHEPVALGPSVIHFKMNPEPRENDLLRERNHPMRRLRTWVSDAVTENF